ncbi:MAG: hypothetical protein PHV85_01785 [Desulfovibrionaceae bacterium]|nr:hypothetical protein [Desulfovibrionaceae bacterium]MDD4951257.1 hypothetical protein [Desulfovibrionaceae bacterium]
MSPRAAKALWAALVPALALTVLSAAPLRAAEREATPLEIKVLDMHRQALGAIEERIEADIGNTDRSPALFILRDLAFFCKTARLELHDIVETYVLEGFPQTGSGFRAQKRAELRTKAALTALDLKKRLQYLALNRPETAGLREAEQIEKYIDQIGKHLQGCLAALKAVSEAR